MDTVKTFIAQQYAELNDVFTDKEAWFLFRAAAFLETLGWTLLITGVSFSYFKWPGYGWVLPIFGSIHGLFFISYVLIVFFGHRSLKWNVPRFLCAEALSVVPYGALVFEWWEARRRRHLL